jgi:hypothetical protein
MYPDVRVVLDYNRQYKVLVGCRALYTFVEWYDANKLATIIKTSYRELFSNEA